MRLEGTTLCGRGICEDDLRGNGSRGTSVGLLAQRLPICLLLLSGASNGLEEGLRGE